MNKCLCDLHLWMGLTVMLKIVGGAGGVEGAGYVTEVGPELRHILQQQKRRNRHMMAPSIMALGVVKVQWLVVFSLAMVSSLWSTISSLNFPEILVRSFWMALETTLFSGCWKS